MARPRGRPRKVVTTTTAKKVETKQPELATRSARARNRRQPPSPVFRETQEESSDGEQHEDGEEVDIIENTNRDKGKGRGILLYHIYNIIPFVFSFNLSYYCELSYYCDFAIE